MHKIRHSPSPIHNSWVLELFENGQKSKKYCSAAFLLSLFNDLSTQRKPDKGHFRKREKTLDQPATFAKKVGKGLSKAKGEKNHKSLLHPPKKKKKVWQVNSWANVTIEVMTPPTKIERLAPPCNESGNHKFIWHFAEKRLFLEWWTSFFVVLRAIKK